MTVAYDVATLPWTSNHYRYVVIMVDMFSKFVEAYPLKDQEARSIEQALVHGWCYRHEYPSVIVSDQGRNVDGERIREWCRSVGIKKQRSSPYHPQGDGQADRSVQTFKQVMRCLLDEWEISKSNWAILVDEVAFTMNSLVNTSTGFSPLKAMYGMCLRTKSDTVLPPIEQRPNDVDETVQRQSHHNKYLDQEIGANINQAHLKKKEYYDRGKSPKNLKVGDEVMVQDMHRADSLSPLYQGLYKIVASKGVDVEVEGRVTGRRQVVHTNRIKKVPHEDGSMHLHEEQKNAEPLSPPDHGGSEKQEIQTTPSIKEQYRAGRNDEDGEGLPGRQIPRRSSRIRNRIKLFGNTVRY